MLTVKQITIGDVETVWEATEVRFDPAHSKRDSAHINNVDSLTVYTGDGRSLSLSEGTILVLNGHGQLVSRYDMGATMVDFGVDPITTAKTLENQRREAGATPPGQIFYGRATPGPGDLQNGTGCAPSNRGHATSP